ncbi:hypothetical protein F1880_007669 [Penicillium rolfsii]|nr:hypothetical protein F1880_007669 [Penicillium rolfsii]
MTENKFIAISRIPEIWYENLGPAISEYIVKPTSYRRHFWNPTHTIRKLTLESHFYLHKALDVMCENGRKKYILLIRKFSISQGGFSEAEANDWKVIVF